VVEGTDRVHVEHIYPQTPAGQKWLNHATIINRLGNLTLLGKRLNASIKNANFATKKRDGYGGTDILMTKDLLAREVWDTTAINERQSELSKWVFDIWKFPGETPPSEQDEPASAVTPSENASGTFSETEIQSPDRLPEVP
jgi:hypothetical protein